MIREDDLPGTPKIAATAASPRLRNPSLRTLIFLGVGSIFFGFLLVGGGAIYNMKQAITASDALVKDVLPEMHHTMALQISLSEAAMPPNDHIIHADPRERERYQVLATRVDQQFNQLLALRTFSRQQTNLALKTRRLWRQAQHTGDAIFTLPGGQVTPRSDKLMVQYDAEIQSAIDTLWTMHSLLQDETDMHYGHMHQAIDHNLHFILGLSVIGLAVMSIGAYFLLSRVLGGVRQLRRGVTLYSAGDFSHRISTDMPAELSEIAHGLNQMADQLGESYRRLVHYSYRDSLTSCLNKRKLDEDMQHELGRSQRFLYPFSLVLLDLDLFKQINDTYGHLAGDEVLQQLVELVSSQLRNPDTLYRYGGEEFVVLMPQTSGNGAHIAAERVRNCIKDTRFQIHTGQHIQITVSIGFASYPVDGDDPSKLLAVADKGLYLAKQEGRNLTRHA